MSFRAEQLGFAYGLHDATLSLPSTGLVAIAGPNGAGKSTLLGILAGLRSPYTGSCSYEGREIRELSRREIALSVGFVPQSVNLEFPFTAEEVVLMGRTVRSGGWYETEQDKALAQQAMSITDTLAFRTRDYRSLSGGEARRVILAAALAQEPRTLLLDEPAAHLDLRHQVDLHRLLARLSKSMLVVAITHDLNLALQFADRVLVLADGRKVGDGTPRDVLTPDLIADVFGVRATIQTVDGRAWVAYGAGSA